VAADIDHDGIRFRLAQRPAEAWPWLLVAAFWPLVLAAVLGLVLVPAALWTLGAGEVARWAASGLTVVGGLTAGFWTPAVRPAEVRVSTQEIRVTGWLGAVPHPSRAVIPTRGLVAALTPIGPERYRIELTGLGGEAARLDVMADARGVEALYSALHAARAAGRDRGEAADVPPAIASLRERPRT
jgi:hypothetical protein